MRSLTGSRLLRGMVCVGGVRRDWSAAQLRSAARHRGRSGARVPRPGGADPVFRFHARPPGAHRLSASRKRPRPWASSASAAAPPASISTCAATIPTPPTTAFRSASRSTRRATCCTACRCASTRSRNPSRIIRAAADNLPGGPAPRCRARPIAPGRCALSAVEGWRGEILYWVRTGAGQSPGALQGQGPLGEQLAGAGGGRAGQHHRRFSGDQQELQSLLLGDGPLSMFKILQKTVSHRHRHRRIPATCPAVVSGAFPRPPGVRFGHLARRPPRGGGLPHRRHLGDGRRCACAPRHRRLRPLHLLRRVRRRVPGWRRAHDHANSNSPPTDAPDLIFTAEYSLNSDGTHNQLDRAPIGGSTEETAGEQAQRGESTGCWAARSPSARWTPARATAANWRSSRSTIPVYDIERFGIHFVASPRHADMLLVTGPVTRNMELALRKTYDATPDPKLVVAVGACGISGGIFGTNYATRGGVDHASRWTSTSPAARRAPRPCSTASCSPSEDWAGCKVVAPILLHKSCSGITMPTTPLRERMV